MTSISEYKINPRFEAKILETKRFTPEDQDEIREISLEVADPGFKCSVNQSFGVLVEHKDEFGNLYHHRLYSVADIPLEKGARTVLKMLVKRCFEVDEFSGEKHPGIASNYLCDRAKGDSITITGPHSIPFRIPEDPEANLLMISMGTGIAPFRALIKHIYAQTSNWRGKIRLFHGAKNGLETLYLNDKDGDLTQYYDRGTFEAFSALSPRPHWADPISLDAKLEEQTEEIRDMLRSSATYVYVAGYAPIKLQLNKAFSKILGSEEKWESRKAELIAGNKWAEVVY
ncbi:MAG: ferredoxin-NADP reductase [Flavobacteriales bacterium]|nr:ferredoxin-NADP reductase [Flavobacteriales bacterium]